MMRRMKAAQTLIVPVAVVAGLLALVIVRRVEPTLGSFTTSVRWRSAAQLHNIARAASALDGVVIQPGEVFSFNETVGACTSERGYVRAPAIIEGRVEDSPGGGVCQVSSTLYNAALLSGLEMIERQAHSYPVASVPPGRDATVVFGGTDLRFRNSLPGPITIRAAAGPSQLVVRIAGRRSARSEFRLAAEVDESAGPDARGTRYLTANVWREQLRDGRLIGREFISSDVYQTEARVGP